MLKMSSAVLEGITMFWNMDVSIVMERSGGGEGIASVPDAIAASVEVDVELEVAIKVEVAAVRSGVDESAVAPDISSA